MQSGQLVLVTLQNPWEKFWGLMLSPDPAAENMRGVDLHFLDDFARFVKSDEAVSASVAFLPMHRVQRIEEDNRKRPSPAEQFRPKTGADLRKFFQEPRK